MSDDEKAAKINSLLDLLRAGDDDARTELVNQSCERLRKLTRKMLRSYPTLQRWEQTDDVLQDAILRLHRTLAKAKPESTLHFYNMATQQIRRTLIDLARHHFGPLGEASHHDSGTISQAIPLPIQRHEGEPSTILEWAEFHEMVDKLTDEERQVFTLLWYEGLTQPEVAALLGMSERTVKRRWHDARTSLFRLMNGNKPTDLRSILWTG